LKKITGRALFYSQTITGVLFVAVPWLATYALSLPFLLNAFVYVAAIFLCFSLEEPSQERQDVVLEREPDLLGFRQFFNNRALVVAGISFGLLGGISGIIEDFRQVYLDVVHFDLQYFGFIYLLLRLAVGVSSERVTMIEQKIGRTATLWLIPTIGCIGYVGLALAGGYWWILFIALDGVVSGISRPLEQEFLHRVITRSRATMISIYTMIEALLRAGFVFAAGFIIEWYGVRVGFAFGAFAFLLLGIPLFSRFVHHDRLVQK
jgi:hypothetical protein